MSEKYEDGIKLEALNTKTFIYNPTYRDILIRHFSQVNNADSKPFSRFFDMCLVNSDSSDHAFLFVTECLPRLNYSIKRQREIYEHLELNPFGQNDKRKEFFTGLLSAANSTPDIKAIAAKKLDKIERIFLSRNPETEHKRTRQIAGAMKGIERTIDRLESGKYNVTPEARRQIDGMFDHINLLLNVASQEKEISEKELKDLKQRLADLKNRTEAAIKKLSINN